VTLRYLGFDQEGNTRTYRFDQFAIGESTVECTISADLRLFAKFHIAIQDGPRLCALKLEANPRSAGDPHAELTAADLKQHEDARALALAQKASDRTSKRRRPEIT
jgi:hypothetical protein